MLAEKLVDFSQRDFQRRGAVPGGQRGGDRRRLTHGHAWGLDP